MIPLVLDRVPGVGLRTDARAETGAFGGVGVAGKPVGGGGFAGRGLEVVGFRGLFDIVTDFQEQKE